MGKGASSKILFAFSSEKWPVQVKSASDEIVKFSAADPGWKAFVQGFTATASKKGFNRVVCVLNSQDGPGTLKLMGTKALPSKTSSEEPDQITGIQGIKGSGVK
jgi:hypothetical protein